MPTKKKQRRLRRQKNKPIDNIVPNAIHRGIVTDYDYMLINPPLYEETTISNFNLNLNYTDPNEDDPNDADSNTYEAVTGSALNAIRIIKKL